MLPFQNKQFIKAAEDWMRINPLSFPHLSLGLLNYRQPVCAKAEFDTEKLSFCFLILISVRVGVNVMILILTLSCPLDDDA